MNAPALEAEELRFEQLRGQRRAVHFHEGLVAARRRRVDGARDQLLAGAALAADRARSRRCRRRARSGRGPRASSRCVRAASPDARDARPGALAARQAAARRSVGGDRSCDRRLVPTEGCVIGDSSHLRLSKPDATRGNVSYRWERMSFLRTVRAEEGVRPREWEADYPEW